MRKQGSTEGYIQLNRYLLGDQFKEYENCEAFGKCGVLVGKPGGIRMNCAGRIITVKMTS
jgi:hypothetical protein